MYKKYFPSIFLYFTLFLGVFIYWAGLYGQFLFDDFPNLQDLGAYGTIDSWDKARNFISNGFSGPTGRPISLASFLIDTNTWPADPFWFKYTNLMIHLLNGVLLAWATILLLKNYNYKEQDAIWIGLLSMAVWFLHPYFVSTTLYVVQRMAQLATLFSLIGIVAYLKARLMIEKKPIHAYVGMTLAIGIATILATYSKENGALLPLLILLIEFCNPNKNNRPIWQWRALCLWVPSIAIFFLLSKYITFTDHPWSNRNFNMIERLYSEARIVTEYLYNLFIPQIELKGLYQDGFIVSRSITQPMITLYSVLFLLVLFISAILLRKKLPLFSFAILFFFAAHLMESTVIGLELYFEHRNYLAALFLFLPLASGLYFLKEKMDVKLVGVLVVVCLSMLSFFTYERAKLWGNTEQLLLFWAKNTPNSPRAQSTIARHLYEQGLVLESNTYLERTISRLPNSGLLTMQLLLQKVQYRLATKQDFINSAEQLQAQPFDAQALQGLRILTENVISDEQCGQYCELTLAFIITLEESANYKKNSVFHRLSSYLKGRIYLAMGDDANAISNYSQALKRYNDVEAGLKMVAELGENGSIENALVLLNEVEVIYKTQSSSNLRRSEKEYDMEIPRLRNVLQSELRKQERHNES